MKYFVAIALMLLLAVGYTIYGQYVNMHDTQQKLLLNEGRSLSYFTEVFRKTYQKAFTDNHIPLDDKTIHLLPVMTIDEISKRFSSKVHGDLEIRTVSDRPRNAKNMANPFEKQMINFFRDNPTVDHRVVESNNSFYYLRPLLINETCMKCHGERQSAPPSIRNRYSEAYGYQLGEIRGLSSVRIVRKNTVDVAFSSFEKAATTTVILYLLLLFALYALIRKMNAMERGYTRHLESEVQEKTLKIEKQKRVFETLFEKSSDGIFILEDQQIIQCNEKIIEMLLYDTKDQLLGQRPANLSPAHQPDGRDSLEKGDEMVELARENGHHQFEWVHTRSNGEEFLADVTMTPITLNGNHVLHVVWRDISDKKKAEEKLLEQKNALHHQAHHDALTNLPNRSLLLDRLSQGIKRADRNETILAIFFIDVDNFKKINDSLGHHIGDSVLMKIAERLTRITRSEDTLARLGGDEFTIVTECSKNAQFSSRLAQDVLELFVEPVLIDGHTLHITASIGISFYPQDAVEVNDLLKYADAAMYKAKNEGKNTYRYYSPEMTRLLLERVTLEEELRQAIEQEEFTVYYQPQLDVVSNKVTGLEALIRWHHPNKGLVYPDTFIPLAEETGLIIEIDRWVMRAAMKQTRAWRTEGIDPGILSLNLSVQQLMSDDFIGILKTEMEVLDYKSEWLELEVTEREMMQDPLQSIERLNKLSQMGIAIAIDDFGTGYSSLSYLKQLPLDKLKIDRSFVQGVLTNNDDASITKAVIALAKSLNLNVIAEGAETSDQADFLVESGCPNIQGYFFGKPMPADEMKDKL
jgi:diguanylate cyclase (GGDEF)-like protein/PAS domain S-box-containing protein